MSEKTVQQSASSLDTVKIGLAVVLVVAGIAGFYLLASEALFVRLGALLVAIAAAVGVLYTSAVGKSLWRFTFDSRVEVRKMVWPTRQEAVQTTLVVALLVLLIGLFMWGVDSILAWIVRSITG